MMGLLRRAAGRRVRERNARGSYITLPDDAADRRAKP